MTQTSRQFLSKEYTIIKDLPFLTTGGIITMWEIIELFDSTLYRIKAAHLFTYYAGEDWYLSDELSQYFKPVN